MLPALPYTQELVFATQTAQSIAKSHRHHVYSGPHLMKALLHDDVGMVWNLEAHGFDVGYLKQWADVRIQNFPKAMQAAELPEADETVKKVMEVADIIRLKLKLTQIAPICALAAVIRPGVVFTADQLQVLPVTENELLAYHMEEVPQVENITDTDISGKPRSTRAGSGKFKNLTQFCVDKTALAKEGKIDPIIGRDGEIRMMTEILCRRTKPNVMAVGDPGVGKTALVEGFALKIVNDEVPGPLKGAKVLELDLGSLIAGASYKGEVEDRLKKIIAEVKQIDRAILFIDEIHMLMGGQESSPANLLKPDLARGEITVIGATTNEEYRKYIEKDEAFSRRFEVLRIEEPNTETAVRMLQAILPKYEAHHQLKMSREAIEQAVGMAQRYLRERSLPDTAVDLMDRTMAAIRLIGEGTDEVIEALKEELTEINQNEAITGDSPFHFRELRWFHEQLRQRISPILTAQVEEGEEEILKKLEDPEKLSGYLSEKLINIDNLTKDKIDSVSGAHIAAIVSYATGIPLGKIQSAEREKLLQMEEELGKRVIGQDHALKVIAESVRISRAGIKEPGKPVGSFFFLGPTGTGKTELAKSLASLLFNDEKALIRFDMSEFKEAHSVSGLIGSPAGYVGYEAGGPLVNKIRQQPYSVVLFDEVEKADVSIFDVFLQILDEGKVKDRMGKEGDFSSAIILFTSNIGSQKIVQQFEEGNIPDEGELKEMMTGYFRPEFLARVSSIIPFSPITEDIILRIFDIHLGKLMRRLKAKGIRIEIDPDAKKMVAMDGFHPQFGARPLIGEIRKQLSQPISRMIIKGDLEPGSTLSIGLDEAQQLTWTVK